MIQLCRIVWLVALIVANAGGCVGSRSSSSSSSIALVGSLPGVLRHGVQLGLLVTCRKPAEQTVRLQATVDVAGRQRLLFDRRLACPETRAGALNASISLPRHFRCYRHSALLSGVYFQAGKVTLRAWLADRERDVFRLSTVRLVRQASLPLYWQLPASCEKAADSDAEEELFNGGCQSWSSRLKAAVKDRSPDRLCRAEKERVHIHDFPLAVHGDIGILTQLQPISEPELLAHWAKNGGREVFSVSTWIYLDQPCPSSWCNILLGMNNDDAHRSPGLLITNESRLHYQGHLSEREESRGFAFLSYFRLPLRTWMRILMIWRPSQIDIGVYDAADKPIFKPIAHSWSKPVHYSDAEMSLLIGGYGYTPSISGYIAQTVLFRGRALLPLTPESMPKPPNFLTRSNWLKPRLSGYCQKLIARLESGLEQRARALQTRPDSCQSWGAYAVRLSQQSRRSRQRRDICLKRAEEDSEDAGRGRRLAEQLMDRRLRSMPLTKVFGASQRLGSEARQQLGQLAYQLAIKLMQTSHFDTMDQSAALLNTSACLGHCSAKFLLSTILSYGLQSDRWMDFTESNALLLENVLRCRHQLSLLALATKHYLGSDGAEANRELALAYFYHLAKRTPAEKDELANEEYNRVDMVRLTDERGLKEVTHADDDLFHWISHQAGRGVPWAKRKMADLLYWGSSGVERNVQEGLNYFKKAADEDESASAAHDYGMLLIKGGHGSHRVGEGLQYLQRAARLTEERDPRTLTSLGWYAERYEGDMAKAISLYRRAAALGGQDAVYNLGVLHDIGYPQHGLAKDRREAFRRFSEAASRGLLHASIMVSRYRRRHMPEIGLPRDLVVATEWARYVAELNPKVGVLLTKAIVAYRKDEIEASALWYTLAAYCGLEVANFNLAHLCDQQGARLTSRFAKECQFHHYNRSVWRDDNQVHAKSLTRMGDYHSIGPAHAANLTAAINFYTRAVGKGDPEAAFNLALLAETGRLETERVDRLVAASGRAGDIDGDRDASWLLMGPEARSAFRLYRLCERLSKAETDLPCRLARYKLKLLTYLFHYLDVLRAALLTGLLVLAAWRYMCGSHR